MPDKVKAEAEGEQVIFPNPFLDTTSGGITFTIYSGIPTGEPPSGGVDAIGGGGAYVAPDPGTQVTFPARGGTKRKAPATVYMAICTQLHEAGGEGVDENGNWTSGVLPICQDAFAAANAHEHPVDRVEAITGPVGVAIAGC